MADRFGDFLIKKGIVGPEQLQEAETVAKSRRQEAAGRDRQAGLRQRRADRKALAKHARLRVLRPEQRADSAGGGRTRARIGRPRKRGHSLRRGGRRAQGARERPQRLRDVRKAAVHSEPQDRHRRGDQGKHSRSDQPQLRPDGRRIGRLDAAGVHRYGDRLHRDRGRRRRRATTRWSTKPAPRSCGWCS